MLIPKSYWRILLVVLFSVVCIFHIFYVFIVLTLPTTPPWIMGDWLINYQGGLVRRGLIGEIALQLSHILNGNIIFIVVVFQVFIFAFFLINTYRLAVKTPFSALTAALIFSPAFLLFPVLDPNGAMRKEIMLFALLAALCCYLTFSKKNISKNLPIFVGLSSIVLVMGHEMLVVYLPYLVCAFLIYEKELGSATKRMFLAFLPAALILCFLIVFGKSGEQVVQAICASLQTYAPPDCFTPETVPGAISFVGKDLSAAHGFVLDSIVETTVITYIITGILSFIPLILIYFAAPFAAIRANAGLRFWLALCIFSSLIGSIPLFWIVADYGRIIYIHITCLSLLALMVIHDRSNVPLRLNPGQAVAWLLTFVYAGSWRLIHWKATADTAFPWLKGILDRFYS